MSKRPAPRCGADHLMGKCELALGHSGRHELRSGNLRFLWNDVDQPLVQEPSVGLPAQHDGECAPAEPKACAHRWVGAGEYGSAEVGYMCGDCGISLDDLDAECDVLRQERDELRDRVAELEAESARRLENARFYMRSNAAALEACEVLEHNLRGAWAQMCRMHRRLWMLGGTACSLFGIAWTSDPADAVDGLLAAAKDRDATKAELERLRAGCEALVKKWNPAGLPVEEMFGQRGECAHELEALLRKADG